MLQYTIRRILSGLVVLLGVSLIGFLLLHALPGGPLANYARVQGITKEDIARLKHQFGLDKPIYIQYLSWMWAMLHGDLGISLIWRRSVIELIAERLPLTIVISLLSTIFVYVTAVPIGIYSATHQYSVGDYSFTVL